MHFLGKYISARSGCPLAARVGHADEGLAVGRHVDGEGEQVARYAPRGLDAVGLAAAPGEVAHGVGSHDGLAVLAPDA